MSAWLRSCLKLDPQQDHSKEGFTPSPLSTALAVDSHSGYQLVEYGKAQGKVLCICTQDRYMTMANGIKFHTGNHPVETGVPLMHLEAVGLEIVYCTPTGKPAMIEEWALPNKDEVFMAFYEKILPKLQKPESLEDIAKKNPLLDGFVAVFVPGGHGAMLGLPEDPNLKQILTTVSQSDKIFLLTICHGPAALLAAPDAYRGYAIVAFPDSTDKVTPYLGYIPGHMPWYFGERLQEECNIKILNKMASGSTHKDRKLITGDSPKAAQAFGVLAATSILEDQQSK